MNDENHYKCPKCGVIHVGIGRLIPLNTDDKLQCAAACCEEPLGKCNSCGAPIQISDQVASDADAPPQQPNEDQAGPGKDRVTHREDVVDAERLAFLASSIEIPSYQGRPLGFTVAAIAAAQGLPVPRDDREIAFLYVGFMARFKVLCAMQIIRYTQGYAEHSAKVTDN